MPDVRRLVRQWVETDAAFGVSEVPLPRQRRAKPAGAQAQPAYRMNTGPVVPTAPAGPVSRAAYVAPPAEVRRPAPPPPGAPRPAPAAPPAQNVFGADDMAKRRAKQPAVAVPPPPAGDIAELPKLKREQKIEKLRELQARAERELSPHFSDVATRVVFGEGDADAPVMFVGEGPGVEEDRQGRPFVGRSGQFLDKQIKAMGYERAQVYIANVVKLRSAEWDDAEGRAKDRPPTPEEVARGIHFLYEQIEIIRPKAIVALGGPAIKWLLNLEGITKVRGTWQNHRGIPVMPTFHPAYVLRNYTEENRRKVWEDLKKVMAKVK